MQVLARQDIEHCLPHRAPFLFLDEVSVVSVDELHGVLRLTGAEPYFAGHFPARPLLPAVLLLEHMAQLAGLLFARARGTGDDGALPLVTRVAEARFVRPVTPPAELHTVVRAVKLFESMGLLEATTVLLDQIVATARLQFGTATS